MVLADRSDRDQPPSGSQGSAWAVAVVGGVIPAAVMGEVAIGGSRAEFSGGIGWIRPVALPACWWLSSAV